MSVELSGSSGCRSPDGPIVWSVPSGPQLGSWDQASRLGANLVDCKPTIRPTLLLLRRCSHSAKPLER